MPFLHLVLGLNNRYADERGRAPRWLVVLMGWIFRAMWESYDGFFKWLFGDGERTVQGDEEGEWEGREGDSHGDASRELVPYGYSDHSAKNP